MCRLFWREKIQVVFAKQVFALPEPPSVLAPVALTPAKLEQELRGPETNFEPRFTEALAKVAEARDVVVLEGGRSWREGYISGLSSKRVVALAQAKVLIVLKYEHTLLADRALAAQDYYGAALMGVVVNATPRSAMSCIVCVRIWISMRWRSGPITEVWSER